MSFPNSRHNEVDTVRVDSELRAFHGANAQVNHGNVVASHTSAPKVTL